MTIAIYPSDVKLMATLPPDKAEAFEKYMADLDRVHVARGSPYGEGSLWKTTGAECWLSFWEDEFSPSEALDEDLSNAARDLG